uniref:Disintegrin and metalloproteinase domain-containing protein B n=1 Tax=Blastobotrys adeninivorans TaxID=409370 RepID=A0A060SWI7_BLAAD
MLLFLLFPIVALAMSVGRISPLSYVSEVHNLTIADGANGGATITLEIPATRRYDNILRRWWAVTDPNNAQLLNKYRPVPRALSGMTTPFGISTEKLFDFLTTNSSELEPPQDYHQYRFTLTKNSISNDHQVWSLDDDGNYVPHPDFEDEQEPSVASYEGTAYRRVASYQVSNGQIKYKYKPVGWARMTVGHNGRVKGQWKVEDPGLGTPKAIYHIDTRHSFETDLFPDELSLLDNLHTSHVVWRDADMRSAQYSDYLIADNDYTPLTESPAVEKRAENLEDEMRLVGADHYMPTVELHRRQSDSSDTGNSGFSSGVDLSDTIGNTNGCPQKRMIALVGVACDCNFLSRFNSSGEAREHVISMVNGASEQYQKAFNITLGLYSIVMANSTDCPSSPNATQLTWNFACDATDNVMGDRLSEFSKWRGEGNRSSDGLTTWSLMTACSGSGSVVGLSWLGMACRGTATGGNDGNSSWVSGTNVIQRNSLDWRIYAHEVGHTFGAVHDCDSSTCSQNLDDSNQCCPLSSSTCDAGGKYIMNPSATDSDDGFSPCSQGNICGAMEHNNVNSTCLTSNSDVHLLTNNECGNGIVEEGEECDCGTEEECRAANDTCCDPKTCKFTSGSQCDDLNDDCCNQCKFASKDTQCRASKGPCDPAEYCTGDSASCPSDKLAPNGQDCKDPDHPDVDGLTCISGHCTSRDLQCRTLLTNGTYSANGLDANSSRACNDETCMISCMGDEDNTFSTTCYRTSQNFLDGTPCRGKGTCQHGQCVNGSNTNPFSTPGNTPFGPNWLQAHKAIVIGVACGIGGLLFLLMIAGLVRRHLRSQGIIRAHKANKVAAPRPGPFSDFNAFGPRPSNPPPPYYPAVPPRAYAQPSYEMRTVGRY